MKFILSGQVRQVRKPGREGYPSHDGAVWGCLTLLGQSHSLKPLVKKAWGTWQKQRPTHLSHDYMGEPSVASSPL